MYISSVMYLLSILGYRIALLLMYLRLFGVNDRFRYATWTVLFFVTGYLFSNLITLIFGCTPITKYWNIDEPGHCIVLVQADYAYGSMNVASDVLMFLLPLPMVWQLRLSPREKLGLVFVFMSGIAYATYSIQPNPTLANGEELTSPAATASSPPSASPSWSKISTPSTQHGWTHGPSS